jgi:hypothetical protein
MNQIIWTHFPGKILLFRILSIMTYTWSFTAVHTKISVHTISNQLKINPFSSDFSEKYEMRGCAAMDKKKASLKQKGLAIKPEINAVGQVVPKRGLEPPHLAVLDPKSSVSTNSTTSANCFRGRYWCRRGDSNSHRQMPTSP